jgi:hypothetical protein
VAAARDLGIEQRRHRQDREELVAGRQVHRARAAQRPADAAAIRPDRQLLEQAPAALGQLVGELLEQAVELAEAPETRGEAAGVVLQIVQQHLDAEHRRAELGEQAGDGGRRRQRRQRAQRRGTGVKGVQRRGVRTRRGRAQARGVAEVARRRPQRAVAARQDGQGAGAALQAERRGREQRQHPLVPPGREQPDAAPERAGRGLEVAHQRLPAQPADAEAVEQSADPLVGRRLIVQLRMGQLRMGRLRIGSGLWPRLRLRLDAQLVEAGVDERAQAAVDGAQLVGPAGDGLQTRVGAVQAAVLVGQERQRAQAGDQLARRCLVAAPLQRLDLREEQVVQRHQPLDAAEQPAERLRRQAAVGQGRERLHQHKEQPLRVQRLAAERLRHLERALGQRRVEQVQRRRQRARLDLLGRALARRQERQRQRLRAPERRDLRRHHERLTRRVRLAVEAGQDRHLPQRQAQERRQPAEQRRADLASERQHREQAAPELRLLFRLRRGLHLGLRLARLRRGAQEQARELHRHLREDPAVPRRLGGDPLAVHGDVEVALHEEAQARALGRRQVAVDGRRVLGQRPRHAGGVDAHAEQHARGVRPTGLALALVVAVLVVLQEVGALPALGLLAEDGVAAARLCGPVHRVAQRAAGRGPELELQRADRAQREEHARIEGPRLLEQRRRRAHAILGPVQRQHQQRPVLGQAGRAAAELLGQRDVGDLELVHVGEHLRALGHLVDGLEADAEEADLLLALGGLADRGHADEVAGVEGVAVVPDAQAGALEADAEGAGAGVLGVLQELDEEVARVGVDAARQQVLGVGLRDGLGRVGQDRDRGARQGGAAGVEAAQRLGAVGGGAGAQLRHRAPRQLRQLVEGQRLGLARCEPLGGAGDQGVDGAIALDGEVVLERPIDEAHRRQPSERRAGEREEQRLAEGLRRSAGRGLGAIAQGGEPVGDRAQDAVDRHLRLRDEEAGEELARRGVAEEAVGEQALAQEGERRKVAQAGAQPEELARILDGERRAQPLELGVQRQRRELRR